MIHLYTARGGSAKKAFDEALPSNWYPYVDRHENALLKEIPAKADFVIHAGKGAPQRLVDWFAAQRGAILICLPEADEWFSEKIQLFIESGEDCVVVDASIRGKYV